MSSALPQAILKTVSYADIFDYPLTKEEVWKWMINVKKIIKNSKIIKEENGFYFIQGREKIVFLRQQREKWSREKFKIAQEVTSFLKLIPSIRLIGITGALAINNAKEEDDIDLFVVTARGMLWTTRFLATLLVELSGRRRHPRETQVADKICLNMFVDEDHLAAPTSERDLFTAHEVVQMKLLWDRDNTYQKFHKANEWVKEYLPNSIRIKKQEVRIKNTSNKNTSKSLFHCFIVSLFHFVEILLRRLQLWYMRKHRTTEVIDNGVIRFHPKDARVWVVKKYQSRLKKYQKLLPAV